MLYNVFEISLNVSTRLQRTPAAGWVLVCEPERSGGWCDWGWKRNRHCLYPPASWAGTLGSGLMVSTSVPVATAKDIQPKGRMVGEQGHPYLFLSPKLSLKLFRAHICEKLYSNSCGKPGKGTVPSFVNMTWQPRVSTCLRQTKKKKRKKDEQMELTLEKKQRWFRRLGRTVKYFQWIILRDFKGFYHHKVET